MTWLQHDLVRHRAPTLNLMAHPLALDLFVSDSTRHMTLGPREQRTRSIIEHQSQCSATDGHVATVFGAISTATRSVTPPPRSSMRKAEVTPGAPPMYMVTWNSFRHEAAFESANV